MGTGIEVSTWITAHHSVKVINYSGTYRPLLTDLHREVAALER